MKKCRWTLRTVCFLVVGLGTLTAVGEAKNGLEDIYCPDAAGWELVFEDDFDRDELGEDWEVVSGNWKVEDGYLQGSGTLISSRGFPGRERENDTIALPGEASPAFQRLEFEAQSDVDPILMPGTVPEVSMGDLSSFIHAQWTEESSASPWDTGYFFQFGGFHNTRNRIARQGADVIDDVDSEHRIIPDKTHTIVVENDEGHLRFFLDGELLYEHEEELSIVGHENACVGLYFYTNARVSNLKVYVKRLPEFYI